MVKRKRLKEDRTEAFPPRYKVFEEKEGFWIEGRDRHPAYICLAPERTHLLIAGSREVLTSDDESVFPCSLYSYHRLLVHIVGITMQNWCPPSGRPQRWSGLHTWARSQTEHALHYRGVYSQWQRLVALVPEPQRSITKAVFAATFNHEPGCETWSEVYQFPYLLEDVLHYRAAACALHYASDLAKRTSSVRAQLHALIPNTHASPLSAHFDAIAQRHRNGGLHLLEPWQDWEEWDALARQEAQLLIQDRQDVLAIVGSDWKMFYAGGKSGKSLRKTLMKLPGGIPGRLLGALPGLSLFLSRPFTDRVELLTMLLWGEQVAPYGLVPPHYWEGNIYAKAQRKEILAALRLLSDDRRRIMPEEAPLKPYRKDLTLLISYLDDYCTACRQDGIAAHQGNIVGLTEKALRWHREAQRVQVQRIVPDAMTPTALPPVPLPDDPAISLLCSVQDVVDEGANMHHCIGSFASRAVAGSCYLFHIHYQDTEASVQVDTMGRVVQAFGPYNSFNAASCYGADVLSRWGTSFPHDATVSSITPTAP